MNINERKCIKRVLYVRSTIVIHYRHSVSWCNLYISLSLSHSFVRSLGHSVIFFCFWFWCYFFMCFVFLHLILSKKFRRQRRIFFDNDSYLFGISINGTWWGFILMLHCNRLSHWHRCVPMHLFIGFVAAVVAIALLIAFTIPFGYWSLCPHSPHSQCSLECNAFISSYAKAMCISISFAVVVVFFFKSAFGVLFFMLLSPLLHFSVYLCYNHHHSTSSIFSQQLHSASELTIVLFSYFYCSSLYSFD